MNKKIIMLFLSLFVISIGMIVAFICGDTMEEIINPLLFLLCSFLTFSCRKGGKGA